MFLTTSIRLLITTLLILVGAGSLTAQDLRSPGSGGPDWNSCSIDQRNLLCPVGQTSFVVEGPTVGDNARVFFWTSAAAFGGFVGGAYAAYAALDAMGIDDGGVFWLPAGLAGAALSAGIAAHTVAPNVSLKKGLGVAVIGLLPAVLLAAATESAFGYMPANVAVFAIVQGGTVTLLVR